MKFNAGDRVKYVNPLAEPFIGEIGTVIALTLRPAEQPQYLIQWDCGPVGWEEEDSLAVPS